MRLRPPLKFKFFVIASAAKQSIACRAEGWMASSLRFSQ